ncbi:MAG: FAD-binding oxidoreductase [Paracoccaceae bacterium]
MRPFPIGLERAAAFTDPLPRSVDVVVIGGGIIGVMTAWYLTRAGQRVALLEKGRIAGEQSGRNWGWVRQQGRDPAELPLMIEARQIWQGLARELETDVGYRQTGVLYLANRPADMAEYEAWMVHARAHDLDTCMLDQAAVAALLPNRAGWLGGIWTASDGRAEPWVAVPALAQALHRAGAVIREACAVRALDLAGGRVTGVVTEAGRVQADRVVLAGGAWSSLLARAHGVNLPQLTVRGTVAATAPVDIGFDGAAADNDFAIRKRLDGGLTLTAGGEHGFWIGPDAFRHLGAFWPMIRKDLSKTSFGLAAPRGFPDGWGTRRRWSADEISPFERLRVLNPPPDLRQIEKLRSQFAAAFPEAGKPKITAAWAGMIDVMPDIVPVIDHVAALPGLTIATGLSGHGFGIGPAVGRVTADLVMGRSPGHDLTRFRLSRFTDGSKISIGPAL